MAKARVQGQPIKTIAHKLGIAPSTVKTHLRRIFPKLEINSSLQLHTRL